MTISAGIVRRTALAAATIAVFMTFAPSARAADGVVLKTFLADSGLKNNWIKGIFRDGDTVLVAHVAGTDRWEPFEKRFVPYVPGPGFSGVKVTGWAEFGGKSYAGTENGLNVREKGKWRSLDRYQQVLHREEILETDGKTLYAAARTMFGGVLRFDGGAWSIVDRGSGTGIMNNATSVLVRGNELFIGTTTNGLFHFDGAAWRVVGPENGLPGVWVTSLAETDEGVWIGCYNGLVLYDGKAFKRFSTGDGLPSNRISCLKVVKGKLVIGTMDAGVSIKVRNLFVNVAMQKGLTDNRIEAIGEADEGAWVGTINGLNLVEVR